MYYIHTRERQAKLRAPLVLFPRYEPEILRRIRPQHVRRGVKEPDRLVVVDRTETRSRTGVDNVEPGNGISKTGRAADCRTNTSDNDVARYPGDNDGHQGDHRGHVCRIGSTARNTRNDNKRTPACIKLE